MSSKVFLLEQSKRATKVDWPGMSNDAGLREALDFSSSPGLGSGGIPGPKVEQEPVGPAAIEPVDLEQVKQEAYEAGLRDGQAASQEQAAAQVQPILERLSNMLSSLAGQRARIRQESEADLIRLSIEIARRILNRELTVDPLSVQGLIKAALAKTERCEVSEVRVSPDQAPTVQICVERLNLASPLEVVADSSLSKGTILFQTAKGAVDASLDTQLKEIERGFADRLGGMRPDDRGR